MVEIEERRRERNESKKHLDHTQKALKDALNEMQTTIRQFFMDLKQVHSDGAVNLQKFATAEENILVSLSDLIRSRNRYVWIFNLKLQTKS